MKLILPENLKNEKAVYIISIHSDMLIIASENKFKPEIILQSADLPQKEAKNAYRVLCANTEKYIVKNGTIDIKNPPFDLTNGTIITKDGYFYIVNMEEEIKKAI